MNSENLYDFRFLSYDVIVLYIRTPMILVHNLLNVHIFYHKSTDYHSKDYK